jgi:hypothetical protein
MNYRTTVLVAFCSCLVLGLPLSVAAQHTRYKLIDVPTLGGPAAWGQVDGPGTTQFINSTGTIVGGAATFSLISARFQVSTGAMQPQSMHAGGLPADLVLRL